MNHSLGHGTTSDTILQFSIRATTAGLDMVDGLSHVAKRMEWYMLLHSSLLERNQPRASVEDSQLAELHDCLASSIHELYYNLLIYEIQCVCYCYRGSQITKMLRALVTLDDWKGKSKPVHSIFINFSEETRPKLEL